MTGQRRETPVKRVSPSGRVTWYARYTNSRGRRVSAGTYRRKSEAQDAIDRARGRTTAPDTLGAYFETWTTRRPRAERTNRTNRGRIRAVLNVELEGRALEDWPLIDLRRRHALELVDHMLRVQGRATTGAVNILRSLSALTEDAITDELAEVNPWRGLKIKANDPRARKKPKEIRVWSFEQMHAFAATAAAVRTTKTQDRKGRDLPDRGPSPIDQWRPVYAEAMIRIFTDCGLRLGEVLPLERGDLTDGVLQVRRTAHEGGVMDGTKTDHGEHVAGREVPVPPGLLVLLKALPRRIDTRLLFPTPTGKLWRERNFYRDVWYPAQKHAGIDMRPHEARHSYVTHLRASGIDDADLADIAGHRVETMLSRYTHPLRASFDAVREAIG